eukprot:6649682-Prymnesium_polylepis.1
MYKGVPSTKAVELAPQFSKKEPSRVKVDKLLEGFLCRSPGHAPAPSARRWGAPRSRHCRPGARRADQDSVARVVCVRVGLVCPLSCRVP